uniref:Hemoglobin beta embryonic-3 n=1 Tax=Sinocyclocheilus grahami TaxID=75366 RepID=A0A672PZN0_SINGR
MVEWTAEEQSCNTGVFAKLDYESVGHESLARCLVVYPWTRRYFGGFGNLYNSLRQSWLTQRSQPLQNMDDIKNSCASLSELYSSLRNSVLYFSQLLFQLLGDCLTVVIATRMRTEFTPDIQAAWQKFLSVVLSALRRQNHLFVD